MTESLKQTYESYMAYRNQNSNMMNSITSKIIPINKPIPNGYKLIGIATDKDQYLFQY